MMAMVPRSAIPTLANVIFCGMDRSIARFIVDPAKLGRLQSKIDRIPAGELDGGFIPPRSKDGSSFFVKNRRTGLIQFGPSTEGDRRPIAFAAIEHALGMRRLPEECNARARLVPRNEPDRGETHAGMIVQLFSALMSIGADVKHDVQRIATDEAFLLSSMRADLVKKGVKLRISTALRFDRRPVPPLWYEEVKTYRHELSPDPEGLSFDIRVGLVKVRDRNRIEGYQRLGSGLEGLLDMLVERDRLWYDPRSRQFGLVVDPKFQWRPLPSVMLMDSAGVFLG